MAKKIVLVDDIDGTDATETVRLSINGTEVELDLNTKNAAKVKSIIQPYIDAGRKTRGQGVVTKKSSSSGPDRAQLTAIREWANGNGFTVSMRGKIPQEAVDAFEKAHDVVPQFSGADK